MVQGSSGMLVPGNDVLKVYFVRSSDPCPPEYSCYISSIVDLYVITQESKEEGGLHNYNIYFFWGGGGVGLVWREFELFGGGGGGGVGLVWREFELFGGGGEASPATPPPPPPPLP